MNEDDQPKPAAADSRTEGTGRYRIMISHRLKEIIEIADTITVLRDGAIDLFHGCQRDSGDRVRNHQAHGRSGD